MLLSHFLSHISQWNLTVCQDPQFSQINPSCLRLPPPSWLHSLTESISEKERKKDLSAARKLQLPLEINTHRYFPCTYSVGADSTNPCFWDALWHSLNQSAAPPLAMQLSAGAPGRGRTMVHTTLWETRNRVQQSVWPRHSCCPHLESEVADGRTPVSV